MSEDTTAVAEPEETTEVDQAAAEPPKPVDPIRAQTRTGRRTAAPQETEPADPWANFEWDGKVESLPPAVQKIVRDARGEAAKARTNAKAQAAEEAAEQARQEVAQQVARALGLVREDEPVDPDALAEQIEQAQSQAWRAGVELQVHRIAGQLGGNAEALLDSLQFIDTLDDLVDTDSSTAEFKTALEDKIREAVEKHPKKYKAAVQEPATPTTASRRPVESLRPGAAPGSGGSADDPNDWLRSRLRDGR